jgi:hypothetical protein
MEYLSNDLLFLQPRLEPFYDWTGLTRLPIFWEDKAHMIHFDRGFDLQGLPIGEEGLKIFSFHPAHIYLNTNNLGDYVQKKSFLKDQAQALKLREEGPGIRTLFLEILERMRQGSSSTLLELTREFKKRNPYQGKFQPPAPCVEL